MVAGFLLFVVIPLLLGDLVNLLIISPIRVPMNKTPIIYYSTVSSNGWFVVFITIQVTYTQYSLFCE